jgi:hypothetical protein
VTNAMKTASAATPSVRSAMIDGGVEAAGREVYAYCPPMLTSFAGEGRAT